MKIILDSNGSKHEINESVSSFCKKQGLSTSSICKVLRGEKRQYKGWHTEQSIKLPDGRSKRHNKNYTVYKDGEEYRFKNIKAFSEEHRICRVTLARMLKGEYVSCGGFTADPDAAAGRGRTPDDHSDTFVISPSGEKFSIGRSVNDFCKAHGLSYPCMIGVINRKNTHHKGWHLPGVEPFEQETYADMELPFPLWKNGHRYSAETLGEFCRRYGSSPKVLKRLLVENSSRAGGFFKERYRSVDYGESGKTVYRIRNLVTGKRYYGSTVDFRSRVKAHYKELQAGVHTNNELQSDWNKYGKDAFEFWPISMDNPNYYRCERRLIKFAGLKNLYNVFAEDQEKVTGRKFFMRDGSVVTVFGKKPAERFKKNKKWGVDYFFEGTATDILTKSLIDWNNCSYSKFRAVSPKGITREFVGDRYAASVIGCSIDSARNLRTGRSKSVEGWKLA